MRMVFPVSHEFSDNPNVAIVFATSSGIVNRLPGFNNKSVIYEFH